MGRNANDRMFHIFYKTTCTTSGKYYYGMHSTDDMNDGYLGSGKHLRASVKKHGHGNHIREVIMTFPDRESLRAFEEGFVNKEFLRDPMCMNIVKGGITAGHYDEEALKMFSTGAREAHRGRVWARDPTTGRLVKVRPEDIPEGFVRGYRPVPEDTRSKMREANRRFRSRPDYKPPSAGSVWYHRPGTREQVRLLPGDEVPDGFVRGKPEKTPEERKRRSETCRANMSSDEARKKVSQRFLGRTRCHGPATGRETLVRGPVPSGMIRGRSPGVKAAVSRARTSKRD